MWDFISEEMFFVNPTSEYFYLAFVLKKFLSLKKSAGFIDQSKKKMLNVMQVFFSPQTLWKCF